MRPHDPRSITPFAASRGRSLSATAVPVHDRVADVAPLDSDRASVVHDVHDLLVGFLGDPAMAADATVDVVIRTAARVHDHEERRFDLLSLRHAAVRHAIALAESGIVPIAPEEVRDLAVLDLVERRGLDRPTIARTAEVRRRSIRRRHDRALERLTGDGHRPADVLRDRADGPWRVAPPGVVAAVAETVVGVPTRVSPIRRVGRITAAATLTLAALAAVGAGGERLVEQATTDVVVGEAVEFTPTPSTGVLVDEQERPQVTTDELGGRLVLPGADEASDAR